MLQIDPVFITRPTFYSYAAVRPVFARCQLSTASTDTTWQLSGDNSRVSRLILSKNLLVAMTVKGDDLIWFIGYGWHFHTR